MNKYSFPPVADENSEILILGTMPGNKSLQVNQYYANPTNQFWRVLSFVTGDNFLTSYEGKKKLLLETHFAIWDVLMHCEREGSLDVNISDEVPNDFKSFFSKYLNIKAVFFNGGKAEEMFSKHNLFDSTKSYATLPSTSSANTSMTSDRKGQIWKDKILASL